MLNTFKIFPINTMELEASIPPLKVKFERIYKNYAWRILQMHENHPIRLRVSSGFPPHSNGVELDWEQFQDWNERENSQTDYIQVELDSDLSPRPSRRRKRRKTRYKKKKVSQLFNLTTKIADLLPSLKIEKIQHEENAPWAKNLNSLINIHISKLNKQKETTQHKELI